MIIALTLSLTSGIAIKKHLKLTDINHPLEPLTVAQPLIYRCDEVTHAFNEEKPVLVAIAAVVLKFPKFE